VLDRALVEVGLDRQHVYVTNAVKHFKFTERGKRRIHETPRAPEITACRPWLEAELEVIRPQVLGVLGATAARVIIGPEFRLLRQHGQFFSTRWSPKTIATIHPSAVLRGEGDAEQARLYAMLCDDLRLMIAA
jgi:DNA polymerase